MDLSVIIVSWNTKILTEQCIKSVLSLKVYLNVEVIVVDNGSTDGSVGLVEGFGSSVILLRNSGNVGFAGANNQAFAIASGRHVLMLNSDAFLYSDDVGRVVEYLDSNRNVAALTPKILNVDGTIQHPGYMRDYSVFIEFLELFNLTRIEAISRYLFREPGYEVFDVAHACGCCLYLRRDALSGGIFLDENLVFTLEDVDVCMRLRQSGWRIRYYPHSKIVHLGGASRLKKPDRAVGMTLQSKYYFIGKHYNRANQVLLAIIMIAASTLKLMKHAVALIWPNKHGSYDLAAYHFSVLRWHFSASRNLLMQWKTRQ